MTTMHELPHWETTPEDAKAAIREIKAAIRARIEASGRSVEEVFAAVEARVAEQRGGGASAWPDRGPAPRHPSTRAAAAPASAR